MIYTARPLHHQIPEVLRLRWGLRDVFDLLEVMKASRWAPLFCATHCQSPLTLLNTQSDSRSLAT